MSTITIPGPAIVRSDASEPRPSRITGRSPDPPIAAPTSPPTRTSIVLVDATSPDGETALDSLDDGDATVVVVVLRRGGTSAALHEYSSAEGMSVDEVAWRYLEQVGDRIRRHGRRVVEVIVDGPDATDELAGLAIAESADRIVFPSSIDRLDRSAPSRLARRTAADVSIGRAAVQHSRSS
jgi:hypothetical protein